MAKNEFARAELKYGIVASEVAYGVTDLAINFAFTEIDVTDTETTVGESEFLGARQTISISFTTFKNAGTADIVLNLTSNNNCIFTADDGSNTTTYTGSLILLTKDVTGNIDGAVQVAYSGRITGALVEAQT